MTADNKHTMVVNYDRMPKTLQERIGTSSWTVAGEGPGLQLNQVHHGDARQLLPLIVPNSVA